MLSDEGFVKKKWLAYLLWLPPFGFLGLHKAYLGQALMSLVYFFTGGGFFLGWISDFFTLNRQVENANFRTISDTREFLRNQMRYVIPYNEVEDMLLRKKLAEVLNSSSQQPRHDQGISPERLILKTAYERKGRISVGDVAVGANLSLEEVEAVLKDMCKKGYCGMNVTDSGRIEYEFHNLFSDPHEPDGSAASL